VPSKKKRLDATVAFIQRRWGSAAISKGKPAQPTVEIPRISTGFTNLDKALVGIGGIPRSRLTEITAEKTAGMTTLALKVIANAQAERDMAAYLDLGATFDPDYASRCGVNLSKLLLVRPQTTQEALEITHSLIASRGVGVLVFDSVTHLLADPITVQLLSATLSKLLPTLSKSPCAAIFLTPLPTPIVDFTLPHTTVRLLFEKERWLNKRRDIRGYEARVSVQKNKLGAAGRSAKIAIIFNGTVRGDST
jgi:recombination protein RecA